MPKRGMSAFFLFIKSRREQLKSSPSSSPALSVTERVKQFSEEWKQLSEQQKQPFVKEAEESKAKSDKARQEYLDANPIPKPPATPYSMFLMERSSSVAVEGTSQRDKLKKRSEIISTEWKAMSEEAKEKYRHKYRDARTAYDQQLKTWTQAQIDKLPEQVKNFAKEAIEGGHFKKPKEIKIVLGDLTKAAARE